VIRKIGGLVLVVGRRTSSGLNVLVWVVLVVIVSCACICICGDIVLIRQCCRFILLYTIRPRCLLV
jgi:hypothetical protein